MKYCTMKTITYTGCSWIFHCHAWLPKGMSNTFKHDESQDKTRVCCWRILFCDDALASTGVLICTLLLPCICWSWNGKPTVCKSFSKWNNNRCPCCFLNLPEWLLHLPDFIPQNKHQTNTVPFYHSHIPIASHDISYPLHPNEFPVTPMIFPGYS